jgi:AMP deaminase
MKELEEEKYIFQEWRISIYGRDYNEWNKLAVWITTFKLSSH